MIRLLHSVTGILPLGAYLIFHLWRNWAMLGGREQWVDRLNESNLRIGFEVTVVFYISLIVHILLSLQKPRVNCPELLSSRGLLRLQQVSGVVGLFFLGYHIYHIWPYDSGPHTTVRSLYDSLWVSLSEPRNLVVYLGGITAIYFHFIHGIFRALIGFGLISAQNTLRKIGFVFGVIGILLWVLTLRIIGHFVTGGSLLG